MFDRYNLKDIEFSNEGDIVLDDGDFKLATSIQTIKQDAYNRIHTNNPDWYRYYNIGSDLEDLFGKDNTPKTAEEGIDKIMNALTYNNRFSASDINIDAVPINKDEIDFFIFINIGLKKPLVIKKEVYL